jgi:Lipoprotein amino terminal region
MKYPDLLRHRRFTCGLWTMGLAALGACRDRAATGPLLPAPSPSAIEASGPGGAPSAATTVESPLDPKARGWTLGQTAVHHLALASQVGFGPENGVADFDLVGDVEWVATQVTKESVTLHALIENARFTSHKEGTRANFEALAGKVAVPYFVTFTGGRVSEVRIATGTDPIVAGIYRTVSAALQLTWPLVEGNTREQPKRWTSFEYDTTGKYAAEYNQETPDQITKRKAKYLNLLSSQSDGMELPHEFLPNIVASAITLRLGETGLPTSVSLQEELELKGAQAPIHSKTRLELSKAAALPKGRSLGALRAERARTERLAVDQPYLAPIDPRLFDRARINGQSFESIVARLEELAPIHRILAAASDKKPEQEQVLKESGQLFAALASNFREKPETLALAVTRIRGGSPASSTLVDALASSGAEPALIALTEVLAAKDLDPALKPGVVTALSRTPRPSPGAARALIALLDDEDLGTQALYGLGTYCRLFREQGKRDESERLGKLIVARFAQADTELKVSTCLEALFNAGYTPALPLVRKYLEDPRDAVRANAVAALRSIESPEVDHLLAITMDTDATVSVRTAAIAIARTRKPSDDVVAALRRAAAPEADAHVRYRATELMGEWLKDRPDLRAPLERVAQTDAEPRIRELAGDSL